MRHQHQRHVDGVVQQQVLLRLAARRGRLDHRRGDTPHHAQQTLHHLLQVGLALAQVRVFHFIELARHQLELCGQCPFGVVAPVHDPVLDAFRQLLILQHHQVDIQQSGQLHMALFGVEIL